MKILLMKNVIAVGVCALISACAHASTGYESVIGGVKDSAGFVSVDKDALNSGGGQNATAALPVTEGGEFTVYKRYVAGTLQEVIVDRSTLPSWAGVLSNGVMEFWNRDAKVHAYATVYFRGNSSAATDTWKSQEIVATYEEPSVWQCELDWSTGDSSYYVHNLARYSGWVTSLTMRDFRVQNYGINYLNLYPIRSIQGETVASITELTITVTWDQYLPTLTEKDIPGC
ncbi:hypothetical protein AB6E89_12625 [Vibrio breoganii]